MRVTLDIPLSLKEVSYAIGSIHEISEDKRIYAISSNSKECQKGDLFFALPGEHFSGEDYIDEAIMKGAFIVSARIKGKNVLLVKDTIDALLKTAKLYQSKLPKLQSTVGITGSVGKTTLKESLARVLSAKYKVTATPENYNNNIGVPFSVFSAQNDTEILILEIGMNHKGEISEIVDSIHLDYAVITNIGTAHIGNLGSREEIAKAKCEIAIGEPVFYPQNEPLLQGVFHGKAVDLTTDIKTKNEDVNRALPFVLAVSSLFLFSEKEVYKILNQENTFSRKKEYHFNNLTVIDDSYNASPEAVMAGLSDFSKSRDKKAVILGDMLELGSLTEDLHEKVGKSLISFGIEYAVFLGVFADYYKNGALKSGMAEKNMKVILDYNNTRDAVQYIVEKLDRKGTVYLKASNKIGLSKAVDDFERIVTESDIKYG